jgi:hypothetical protein
MIELTHHVGQIFLHRSGAQYRITAAYGGHGSIPEIYHLTMHKPTSAILRADQWKICVTLPELQGEFQHLAHLDIA